ncbi:hypothetical protein [Halothiobacillus sp.]|uniref:hypothetical protein n=1 Tax=Halothiobacillus sp. TaxID=1891311 RepID=UPI00262A0D61|nr:hypothetical protein [Halothiobacillus sp.]
MKKDWVRNCSLFQAHIDPKQTDAIRSATNQNRALGNQRFREEVARLTGRRTEETKRRGKETWGLLNGLNFVLTPIISIFDFRPLKIPRWNYSELL